MTPCSPNTNPVLREQPREHALAYIELIVDFGLRQVRVGSVYQGEAGYLHQGEQRNEEYDDACA